MLLLQHSAQYLSRRQPRNLGNDHDPAQLFVRRQPLRDEGEELVGIHRTACCDRGDDRFTVRRVFDTENRAVGNPRMPVQHRLDLGRRDRNPRTLIISLARSVIRNQPSASK
jgi:hypothetical protein